MTYLGERENKKIRRFEGLPLKFIDIENGSKRYFNISIFNENFCFEKLSKLF